MRYAIASLIAAVIFAGIILAAQTCLAMNDQLLTEGYQQTAGGFVFVLGQAASDEELVLESGGAATEIDEIYMQLNNVGMNAEMDHNNVESHSTGFNFVGDNALANTNGFSTVIQNSGNGVIIQDNTIVTVNMY
jgi:hypothetical protein